MKSVVSLRPIVKYVRDYPIKASKEIKKFIEKENYSVDELIVNAGLEFDYYKFERNLNVFSGALEKLPANLEVEQKKRIKKLLRDVKKQIDEKLVLLKD